MRVHRPGTVEEACTILAGEPDAIPLAGGTDLLVHWPVNLDAHARTYVDLSRLGRLRTLEWRHTHLVLGGLTTYWDVLRDASVGRQFPLLVDAARQVGAVQIQARGTWAGNIVNASPAADGVPVLMAYDAVVVLVGPDGEEEEVPLSEFYTGYKAMRRRHDQLVTAIRLPRADASYQRFEKVGPRRAQAITKVGVAIVCAEDGWRVVANSVAPTVCRCRQTERLLEVGGAIAGPDDFLPALDHDIAPIDDIRSTARYRKTVLARLLYYDLRGHHPAVH